MNLLAPGAVSPDESRATKRVSSATPPKNRQPYRVLTHGLTYFCGKLSAIVRDDRWQVLDRSGHRPHQLPGLLRDLASCDLAYTWGGRISMGKFLWAMRLLGKRKLIMLWSGSDVLFAQREHAAGVRVRWIENVVHWAVSPWVAEEVRELGLPCEYVQASFVDVIPQPKPLPKKFSVLIFVRHVLKADLYGWDRMVEVAQQLPHIHFQLCGLPDGQTLQGPPNITVHNWMPNLTPLLDETTVIYRPVRHDGLSFTVLEALSHGRYVLYSYPLPGCTQVTSTAAACTEIAKLYAQHQSGTLPWNDVGRSYIAREYAPEKVTSELLRRWEHIILAPAS
jgi:hypothetical protein